MHRTPDRALYLLDQVTSVRSHSERVWRSAIREAMASRVPIEQVATRAGTTIEEVLAILDEFYAQAA
jgi:hypothetical protein